MTVGALLEVIKRGKEQYADFLNWTIALEQHPGYKECCNCNKAEDSVVSEDMLFIKSHAMECCTYFTKQKVFGIQIHY